MVQKKQRNKSQRSLKIIVYSEVVVLHCTRETSYRVCNPKIDICMFKG